MMFSRRLLNLSKGVLLLVTSLLLSGCFAGLGEVGSNIFDRTSKLQYTIKRAPGQAAVSTGTQAKFVISFSNSINVSELDANMVSDGDSTQSLNYSISPGESPTEILVTVNNITEPEEIKLSVNETKLLNKAELSLTDENSIDSVIIMKKDGPYNKIFGYKNLDTPSEITYHATVGNYLLLGVSGDLYSYNTNNKALTNLGVTGITYLAKRSINFNAGLVFIGQNSSGHYKMYFTDGTLAGTTVIKDFNPGGHDFGSSLVTPSLYKLNESVFYIVADNGSNVSLYESDGTDGGTNKLVDIDTTGNLESGIYGITSNYIYIVHRNSSIGRELFSASYKLASVVLTQVTNASGTANGFESSYQLSPVPNIGDELYFTSYSGGYRLSRTDGDSNAVVVDSSDRARLYSNVDGRHFFLFKDLVREVNPSTQAISTLFTKTGYPVTGKGLLKLNSNFYLTWTDSGNTKIYTWDGTAAEPTTTISENSEYEILAQKGNSILLRNSNYNLFTFTESEGFTALNTKVIVDKTLGAYSDDQSHYYFSSPDYVGYQIGVTDFTLEGTKIIASHHLAKEPSFLTKLGGDVYFDFSNNEIKDSLFVHTNEKTEHALLSDLTPTSAKFLPETKASSNNYFLVNFKDRRYGYSAWLLEKSTGRAIILGAVDSTTTVGSDPNHWMLVVKNMIKDRFELLKIDKSSGNINLVKSDFGYSNKAAFEFGDVVLKFKSEVVDVTDNYIYFNAYNKDSGLYSFYKIAKSGGEPILLINGGSAYQHELPEYYTTNHCRISTDDLVVFVNDQPAVGINLGAHYYINASMNTSTRLYPSQYIAGRVEDCFWDSVNSFAYFSSGGQIYKSDLSLNSATSFLSSGNSDFNQQSTKGLFVNGSNIYFMNGWVGYMLFSSDLSTPNATLVRDFNDGPFNDNSTSFGDFASFELTDRKVMVNNKFVIKDHDDELFATDGTNGNTTSIATGVVDFKQSGSGVEYSTATGIYHFDGTSSTLLENVSSSLLEYVKVSDSEFYYLSYTGTNAYKFGHVKSGVDTSIITTSGAGNSLKIDLVEGGYIVVKQKVSSVTTFKMIRISTGEHFDLTDIATDNNIVPLRVDSALVNVDDNLGTNQKYILDLPNITYEP